MPPGTNVLENPTKKDLDPDPILGLIQDLDPDPIQVLKEDLDPKSDPFSDPFSRLGRGLLVSKLSFYF